MTDKPTDRPSLYDENPDPAVWSNTARSEGRLTWREVSDHQESELLRLRAIAALVSDLDRCVHGRHLPDDCFGCQAEGHPRNGGNPHLSNGQRVGSTLGGRPIVIRFVDNVVKIEEVTP